MIEIMARKTFTEKQLKDFVIKLRKKQRDMEEQRNFCHEHNFIIEKQIQQIKADLIQNIVHEMEREFDLGFVWDDSLN